jgi:RES domain-containing protein
LKGIMPFKAQPLTLVGYRVECERVVDLTDPVVRSAIGVTEAILASPWEDLASRGLSPPTWDLSRSLVDAGHHGVLVPSFAPGTVPTDRNLVLWRWSDNAPCQVNVVDDFSRLPKDDTSWR